MSDLLFTNQPQKKAVKIKSQIFWMRPCRWIINKPRFSIDNFESYLVVEEVNGVLVEPEWERLEEWDVVGHDLLVREVELVHDDRVHVVVGQKVVWNGKM